MKVNGERLLTDLFQLRQFTDTPGEGVTRFSYGQQDQKARAYLLKEAGAIGCAAETDALKNIRIGMPQNTSGRQKVVIGSHIDTVRNGGWLDGIYGVTAGLEVMRVLKDCRLEYDLELVIFAEEEGSNFGSTMTGSKFISGDYKEEDLDYLKNDEGLSLRQILENPSEEELRQVKWDFSELKAMLELHIEQGPVLEREGLSLGIVETIFGMRVIEVEVTGVGNHAGATPMEDRKDALCAAAECILAAERIVKPNGHTVVTVGRIKAEPDCSNVIPEKTVFTLEARDGKTEKIDYFINQITAAIKRICRERQVECQIREVSSSEPLKLDPELSKTMERLASQKKIPYRVMDSGAVHDACMIAKHAKTGMIFVPSIGGRSHVPEEDTRPEDLVQGAQFLLEVAAALTGAE